MNTFNFNEIKAVIKRRAKVFTIVFFPLLITSATIALIQPAVYRSQTTILIEQPQVSEQYFQSSISSDVKERLKAIMEQVLSRTQLLYIIEQFNLYTDMRKTKTTEEIIARIKSSIKFEYIYTNVANEKTGKAISVTTAFILSFEGDNPHKVQQITNVLASLFKEGDLRSKEINIHETSAFIEQEMETLKENLRRQEERIQTFKEKNLNNLPENNDLNLRSLERFERELERVDLRIRSLEEKKLYLSGEITTVDPLLPIKTSGGKYVMNPKDQLKRLRMELISLQAKLSDKHPDVKRLKNEIKEIEAQVGTSEDTIYKIKRLDELNGRLIIMKGELDNQHPDVITLKKEIQLLNDEINAQLPNRDSIEEEHPENPAYISLKIQIAVVEAELKNSLVDRKTIQENITKYQNRLELSPRVEKEYLELYRDYDSTKRKYKEMSQILMEARVAKEVEQSQRGERFTIIDPAFLPEKPYKPNRIAILILGFVIAFGLGIGMGAVYEYMDTSIKTVDELNYLTNGSVFSVVSRIEIPEEKQKRSRKRLLYTCIVLITIVIAAFIFNYFIPLDTIWLTVKQRIAMS